MAGMTKQPAVLEGRCSAFAYGDDMVGIPENRVGIEARIPKPRTRLEPELLCGHRHVLFVAPAIVLVMLEPTLQQIAINPAELANALVTPVNRAGEIRELVI